MNRRSARTDSRTRRSRMTRFGAVSCLSDAILERGLDIFIVADPHERKS